MLEKNQRITLTGDEALDALKEIEFILISLHKMGQLLRRKTWRLRRISESDH